MITLCETSSIAPGGMIAVTVEGRDFIVCNCENEFYVVQRQCGHLKARLETGSLEGFILTCPLHYAQFDIRTGEALSGPVPDSSGSFAQPRITENLATYPVKVEEGLIKVELPDE